MAFAQRRRKALRLRPQRRYPRSSMEKLVDRWQEGLFLCVGLDPDYEQLPSALLDPSPTVEDTIFEFNRRIIETTARYVCAYKPNLAFYEQNGPAGLVALKRTCDFLKENYPGILVILDAKRGDIASTNRGYAAALFDYYRGDAVTLHPYLGREALVPFLVRPDKLNFILCRTSNLGGAEIQSLRVDGEPLYMRIARMAQEEWNHDENVGLVAGATYPHEIAEIRAVAPDLPLLVPGIGSQGGDLEAALKNGRDQYGGGLIISSSRSIIYASSGEDFAEAAGQAAEKLATQIKDIMNS